MLRFYIPVNPMGSCQARSVYLTTLLLGRLSPHQERMLPTRRESNLHLPDHQLDAHPTEPPKSATTGVKINEKCLFPNEGSNTYFNLDCESFFSIFKKFLNIFMTIRSFFIYFFFYIILETADDFRRAASSWNKYSSQLSPMLTSLATWSSRTILKNLCKRPVTSSSICGHKV